MIKTTSTELCIQIQCELYYSLISPLSHPLFFFRLASNAFPDIGSVGWIEKKKNFKKNHKKSQNEEALVPQDNVKS